MKTKGKTIAAAAGGLLWAAACFGLGIFIIMNMSSVADTIFGTGLKVSSQLQPVEEGYAELRSDYSLRVYNPVWFGTFGNSRRGYIQADWEFKTDPPEVFRETIIDPETGEQLCSVEITPESEYAVISGQSDSVLGVMDKTSFAGFRQTVTRTGKRGVFRDHNRISVRFIIRREK